MAFLEHPSVRSLADHVDARVQEAATAGDVSLTPAAEEVIVLFVTAQAFEQPESWDFLEADDVGLARAQALTEALPELFASAAEGLRLHHRDAHPHTLTTADVFHWIRHSPDQPFLHTYPQNGG